MLPDNRLLSIDKDMEFTIVLPFFKESHGY